MFTRISSAITSTLNDNSTFITEKYSTLSDTFNDNYSTISNKLYQNYPTLSSGLTNTKSSITQTFNDGTTYIYSIPTFIGDKVDSVFEPVKIDGSEERGITRTPPNENLAEGVIPLDHDREKILYQILDLYSCRLSKDCFESYEDDVIFDDPIIYTTGLSNLKAQFYGMQKLFVKSTTEKYQVLENTPNVLRINLNQKYTLPFVSRAVVYNSEIILQLRENKITKHVDCWNGKSSGGEGMIRKGIAKVFTLLVSVPEN